MCIRDRHTEVVDLDPRRLQAGGHLGEGGDVARGGGGPAGIDIDVHLAEQAAQDGRRVLDRVVPRHGDDQAGGPD